MTLPSRVPVVLALAGVALAASGAVLAEEPVPGRVLFEAQGCPACHAVPAAGVAKVGDPTLTAPALENVDDEYSRCGLKRWLKRTKMHDGLTHLQRFHGTPEELDVLVRWLLEQ